MSGQPGPILFVRASSYSAESLTNCYYSVYNGSGLGDSYAYKKWFSAARAAALASFVGMFTGKEAGYLLRTLSVAPGLFLMIVKAPKIPA